MGRIGARFLHAADRDHPAEAARQHPRQESLQQPHRGVEVDLRLRGHRRFRDGVPGLQHLDRGAEHEDIGLVSLCLQLCRHRRGGGRLGEIGDQGGRPEALCSQIGYRRMGRTGVPVMDDRMRAGPGQARRDRKPDAARRAGDEGDPARKRTRHQPSSGFTRAVASSIACWAGLRPSTAACVSSMKMSWARACSSKAGRWMREALSAAASSAA